MIGVGGCVASQEGDGIARRAPFVDLVFGPQTLHQAPGDVRPMRGELPGASVVDVSFPEIEKFDRLPEPRAEGPTAFVSVMEGCAASTAASASCRTPAAKKSAGRWTTSWPRSSALAEQGVREINLLGQNVNAYRGPMHDGQVADLATLIYYVAAVDTAWSGFALRPHIRSSSPTA